MTRKKKKKIDWNNIQIIIGIILFMAIIITGLSMLFTHLKANEPDIPPEEIINATCQQKGLIPKGYEQNFHENRSYILCGIPYKPTTWKVTK